MPPKYNYRKRYYKRGVNRTRYYKKAPTYGYKKKYVKKYRKRKYSAPARPLYKRVSFIRNSLYEAPQSDSTWSSALINKCYVNNYFVNLIDKDDPPSFYNDYCQTTAGYDKPYNSYMITNYYVKFYFRFKDNLGFDVPNDLRVFVWIDSAFNAFSPTTFENVDELYLIPGVKAFTYNLFGKPKAIKCNFSLKNYMRVKNERTYEYFSTNVNPSAQRLVQLTVLLYSDQVKDLGTKVIIFDTKEVYRTILTNRVMAQVD